MPKPPPDPINRKNLRQALRSWDNSQKLGAQSLARLKTVEARRRLAGYGGSLTGYGVALRDALHAALLKLKPTGSPDPSDKRWRPYLILHGQYIEGRSPDYLVEQLNVARSTYDHEQADALETLAGVLREQEHTADHSQAVAVQRPFLAPTRSQLPLVGRDSLLDELKTKLLTRGVAALNGLPGVGKTALATQLAHDLLDHFADGALWVGLGRAPDTLAAFGVWAVALGLPLDEIAKLGRIEDRAKMIHAAISLKRMLIVIDDAWTIDDALAFKIGGPNCAYLLTTRLPKLALDFAGDSAITVHELDAADGLSLLAGYRVVDDEARSLVETVGGLPLALALVGRYLQKESALSQPRRLRSALDRLQRIGETLMLTEPRSPLEAQAAVPMSVFAVIGLTDDVLDSDSRLALRALSVFPPKPNSFGEDAALAVSGTPAHALDALVDYGLLESAAPGRYLLHPTIAEFAILQSTDRTSYHARLAAYFARFAEDHRADDSALELETANLLAALSAAHDQAMRSELIRGLNTFYPFLEMRGLHALAEPHLGHAEAAARHLNDRAGLCAVLLNSARALQRRADYARAQDYFNEALALARTLNESDQICSALSGLGVLAFSRGDYAGADTNYTEALTLARQHDLRDRLSGLLANMGALRLTRGDAVGAEACFDEGLALARALGSRSRVSALLINLGVSAARRGDLGRADLCFQESLELARAAQNREQIIFLLTNLGTLASDRRDLPRAEACFNESLTLARELDDRARISHLLANLGALSVSQKDFAKAEACYSEGLSLARAIGHRENIILLLTNCGELEKHRGNLDAAKSKYEEALALAKEIGHQRYIKVVEGSLLNLGDTRQTSNDME
ncbi:MAG TPA: tetratricopeptide repeat protein [Anaerolineales bacterium]|nr:tetratricopeptide repeat protein [Anaerolineales bacterium]